MRRRAFIALLGVPPVAASFIAGAQQPAMPIIGFLNSASPDGFADRLRGFRQGLTDSGFVEGQNAVVEYRWAENQIEHLPELADDLVRRRVSVIVATGNTRSALAAKKATTTIPIVFSVPDEPVKSGLVSSLARPVGNATGIYFFTGDLIAKRLELSRMLLPKAILVAVLVNPANRERADSITQAARSASVATGLQVRVFHAGTSDEIDEAFAMFARERPDALLVAPDVFFLTRRVQITILATRHAIPVSYSVRDFVEAGGLMSYGTNVNEAYRQVGVYTGRILKGAKPSDLPVVQSDKFELVVNLKTAKALGLTIPQSILARADEVIE
jgi:putative ABC transport system substrate-binding protein